MVFSCFKGGKLPRDKESSESFDPSSKAAPGCPAQDGESTETFLARIPEQQDACKPTPSSQENQSNVFQRSASKSSEKASGRGNAPHGSGDSVTLQALSKSPSRPETSETLEARIMQQLEQKEEEIAAIAEMKRKQLEKRRSLAISSGSKKESGASTAYLGSMASEKGPLSCVSAPQHRSSRLTRNTDGKSSTVKSSLDPTINCSSLVIGASATDSTLR